MRGESMLASQSPAHEAASTLVSAGWSCPTAFSADGEDAIAAWGSTGKPGASDLRSLGGAVVGLWTGPESLVNLPDFHSQ